ncbi:hypothetical protein I656_01702 [Geobacillus sp. WSUCF1]|nr:hypothetical protein I656_01702 [Geobacillus sp. WSUCF1]
MQVHLLVMNLSLNKFPFYFLIEKESNYHDLDLRNHFYFSKTNHIPIRALFPLEIAAMDWESRPIFCISQKHIDDFCRIR